MKLHEALSIDLAAIDAAMESVVRTDPELPIDSPVAQGVLRLIRSGGKRLRPMLVQIGGRFGASGREERLMRIAVLLEFLHMASLVHDDVIDDADTRRGETTLHRATDIRTAVYAANYMMARAMEWAAQGDDGVEAERSANLLSLVTQLCMGEYDQLHGRFDFGMTIKQYLQKTRRKTALLIASCLQAGALAADADKRTADLLYEFGDALGIAFQIQDDLLDFTQSAEKLGKPAGSDLRNGNVTAPVLYALELPGLGVDIRALRPESPEAAFRDIIARIAASDAIARTEALRAKYADRASRFAARLASHPTGPQLGILLDTFVHRTS
ncbi:polyprenyl synthetase family protein [Paenibacillus sp. TRM 82003]|nr:polyprenyl synthetase family protein [Paenibacillus sp. TRM 82003]